MTTSTRARSVLMAMLIPLALVAGACGGSSDDASSASTTAATSSGGGGDFCSKLESRWGKVPTGATAQETVEYYQQLAEGAPAELKPDFDAIIAQLQFGADNKDNLDKLDEYAEINAKNIAAQQRIVQYLSKEC